MINKFFNVSIPPMGIKYFYTFLLLIGPMFLESRPISYSGGSTLMLKSNAMQNSDYYHYSPSYKFSIGIEQVKDKYFDADYSSLRLTYLLNRKIPSTLSEIYTFNQASHRMGLITIFMGFMVTGKRGDCSRDLATKKLKQHHWIMQRNIFS